MAYCRAAPDPAQLRAGLLGRTALSRANGLCSGSAELLQASRTGYARQKIEVAYLADEVPLRALAFLFAQTDARSATILRDEIDACVLQDTLNGFEVVRHRDGSPSFEISHGTFADLGLSGQLSLRELDQRARGATLSWGHSSIIEHITIFSKDTE